LSQFCHGQELKNGFVYEWSRERDPERLVKDPVTGDLVVDPNPNVKYFAFKSAISTYTFLDAYNYKTRVNPTFIKVDEALYVCSDLSNFSKSDVKEYLNELDICEWTHFDALINRVTSCAVINLEEQEWENSKCSAKTALKIMCVFISLFWLQN
jgi:hypothetical protein